MIVPRLPAFAVSVLALAVPSIAQPPATPLERAVESRADAPATIDDKAARPIAHDPEIEQLMGQLTGSFVAEASGETPMLRLNTTAIRVEHLDNAVYFEVARADAPAAPFRQGVLHGYRYKSELRLRVFDLAGNPGLKDTLTGLWAAPESLPTLTAANLDPNLDLVMTKSGSGWSGATPHAYPVARDGAVEMTATISVSPSELRMADSGFNADGTRAWGDAAPGGGLGGVFRKSPALAAQVNRVEGGLTIITLVPPAPGSAQLAENGQVAVQYTGWLTDGSRFDTSRQPGREAFMLRVPGPVIKGWNEGLKSIAKGERRRLVIPPTLAYGERGTRDGRIPPNSTLIFDIECVYLDNTQPPPPAAAAPVSPHGMAPTTPPPPPAPAPKPTESTPK